MSRIRYYLLALCSETKENIKEFSGKIILTVIFISTIMLTLNPIDTKWDQDLFNAYTPVCLWGSVLLINTLFFILIRDLIKCDSYSLKKIAVTLYDYIVYPTNKEFNDNLTSFVISSLIIMFINYNKLWILKDTKMQNLDFKMLISKELFYSSLGIVFLMYSIAIINNMIFRRIKLKIHNHL